LCASSARSDGMRRSTLGCVMVIAMLVACSSGPPTGPSASRRGTCGLGPLTILPLPGEPLCSLDPRCPRARPATAQTIIAVSTCGFGANEASCTPVQLPGCPSTERVALDFRLANPDEPGSICTGNVHLVAEATRDGGAVVRWDAQELEETSTGCRLVGPEYGGETTVEGPCCQLTVDILLPMARRTFRVVVRTDWH
jgi:hypothetical protein